MKPTTFSPSPHYPFGMLTPGRNWSAESEYRFGFNGVENDSNIKGNGNHISTFWRQYDTRLARWMSPEPKSVAWESVYASFRNNPIYYSDPNGDWVKGAGFFRNLFNSDDKIDAENKAA
ncbi:MAG: RHS repeat-associated core domain-containing protein, partial [Chitinophagales bacterium]